MDDFDNQNRADIQRMATDANMQKLNREWFDAACSHKYSYHFKWLGLPIIQFPQDMVAVQEVIWETKPDCIVETGIARGGSLIFYASLLRMLGKKGKVIGIDIDIREHNRKAIEAHPLVDDILMIQGSSTDDRIAKEVADVTKNYERIMVVLDSNHTHDHVLQELKLYSPLVTKGCYLVVFDTVVEDMPSEAFPDRPWGKGNNPRTAVREFLKTTDRFLVDDDVTRKLLITVAPGGYLKCIK